MLAKGVRRIESFILDLLKMIESRILDLMKNEELRNK